VSGEVMATTLQIEEILKAAQAMSKEERLKLIAEIAALPNSSDSTDVKTCGDQIENTDQEVMKIAYEFMDKHSNLLRRLAE
jgi:hypothetical protein